jgi:hypothetical protein
VRRFPLAALLLLVLPFIAGAASAQSAPDTCTYRRCALTLLPVWNGLTIVRGENEERVGRLGFFWPEDVSPLFAGNPQALSYAKNAVRVRHNAAILTDAGAALLLVALIGGFADSGNTHTYQAIAIGGAISFGVGVPVQFAADGELSRAVWWHNSQWAR